MMRLPPAVPSGGKGCARDEQNAVWYADVPNKRCVRVAEGGAVRQTVELDRGGFACALGGPRRTTLFIVAAEWRAGHDRRSRSQVLIRGGQPPRRTTAAPDSPAPGQRDQANPKTADPDVDRISDWRARWRGRRL